jgi:hypothetical protein
MHPYVTDSKERRAVPPLLVVLSGLTAWGLHAAVEAIGLPNPWWLDMPSLAGFYAVFYRVFDRHIWRLPILRKIGLIKVPEIRGKWEGYVTSSFDKGTDHHAACLEIRQTWTRIRVTLHTDSSRSNSLTAAILTETPDCILVSYEYLNEPAPLATSTMHAHRGTARHIFRRVNGKEVLNGQYYTGRDRGTQGCLHFRRDAPTS